MGRGKTQFEVDGNAISRGGVVNEILNENHEQEARTAFLAAENTNEFTGELVAFNDSNEIALEENDPQIAIKGLAIVSKVTFLAANKKHKVEFKDGIEALVVLNPPHVALSDGSNSPKHVHAALYAAQAYAARFNRNGSPERLALADASATFIDSPTDPEALRKYAQAAVAYNESLDYENVDINDPDLLKQLNPQQSLQDLNKPADNAFSSLLKQMRKVAEGPNPHLAPHALLYAVDAEQGLPPEVLEKFEKRREAAIRLGGEHLIPQSNIAVEMRPKMTGEYDKNGDPIYETDEKGNIIEEEVSVGDYFLSSAVRTRIQQVRYNMVNGTTTLAIDRSDPGLGKNSFWREIGAMENKAVMEINLGPNYDINDALGGEGLSPSELFETKIRPVETGKFNEDGSPIYKTDENGEVVTEEVREFKAATTSSKQKVGPLLRYAQEPCIIVINEPEGVEDTLVQLNEAFGSRIGDRSGRYASVNSISGEASFPIHEDCTFVITYNPGANEIQMPHSVHSRALNMHMDPLTDEEDAQKLSIMVSKAMKAASDSCPSLARDYTPEEVMPFVQLRKRFQNLYRTNPGEWIAPSDDRQAALMFNTLMQSAYEGNSNSVATMLQTQRYLLPGSYNMTEEEREVKLREQLADFYTEINELVDLANECRKKDKGEK